MNFWRCCVPRGSPGRTTNGKTYVFFSSMWLEVYTLERDPTLDQRIRAALDAAEIAYYVHYTWIESEGLYETIFEIEV